MSRLAGVCLSSLLIYFAYHAFAGEQGLGKWRDMQKQAADLREDLNLLETELSEIESRIARLDQSALDRDYVEALIHDRLIYAHPNELVLVR